MVTAKKEEYQPSFRAMERNQSLPHRVSMTLKRVINAGEYRDDHGKEHRGFYVHPDRVLGDLEYMLEVDDKAAARKKTKKGTIWTDDERAEVDEIVWNGIGDVYPLGKDTIFEDGQPLGPINSSDTIYPRNNTTSQRRAKMFELALKGYLLMEKKLHKQYQNGHIDEISFEKAQGAITGTQLSAGIELYKMKRGKEPLTRKEETALLFQIWEELHPEPQKA